MRNDHTKIRKHLLNRFFHMEFYEKWSHENNDKWSHENKKTLAEQTFYMKRLWEMITKKKNKLNNKIEEQPFSY